MKFFWLLVGVVVIAAGTMLLAGRATQSAPKSLAAATPAETPAATPAATPTPAPTPAPAAKPTPAPVADAAKPTVATSAADASPTNPGAKDHIVAPASEKPLQASEGAAPAAPSKTEAVPMAAPTPAKADDKPEAKPSATPAAQADAKPAPAAPAAEAQPTPASSPASAAPAASAIPASDSLVDAIAADAMPRTPEGDVIVRQDDAIKIIKKKSGEMLVDDRYALKGDGSAAAPYEITWEYLLSAQETYDPKKGKKKIPERLSMLDGKQVRITGYIAFPLMAQSPKELLAMLNQWDGCCIGVPPTPYDAIEVRLDNAATQEEKFTNYGSVEGVFQVKPYVVGEWLVGLYVMNDAKLASKNSRVGT
jgi:outer membrane biosynthesis protein TonB